MAEEKRGNFHKNSFQKWINVFIPIVIYIAVYLITAIVLTGLVSTVALGHAENGRMLPERLEPTVHAIANALAMLAGTLPLFPAFRKEIGGRRFGKEEAMGPWAEKEEAVGHRSEKGEAGWRTEERPDGIWKRILLTLLLAAAGSLAINILFIELHLTESSQTYSQVAENQYGVLFPVGLFLYGVISPFAEELVFRGIVYQRIKKNSSVFAAALLSALLFGMYHGNLVQGAYGFLMGCLIACVFECFGHFFYALLFHAAANVTVYTVTSYPALYEVIITPCYGVIFTGISVLLIVLIYIFIERRRKSGEA